MHWALMKEMDRDKQIGGPHLVLIKTKNICGKQVRTYTLLCLEGSFR